MQVFRAFIKIVKKKIPSVIMYFVIFTGVAIAMGMMGEENEVKKFSAVELTIAVDNKDNGSLGKELVEYLKKQNTVVAVPDSEEKVLDEIYQREIDYVLYIPENFTDEFVKGNRDDLLSEKTVPSSYSGEFAKSQIEGFLKTTGIYIDNGIALEEAVKLAADDYSADTKVEFLNNDSKSEIEPGAWYFRYLPYVFLCIMISAVSPVFMEFNRKNVSARNKVSAMSFTNRNMQMILGSAVIALMQFAFFIVVALILYGDYVLSARGMLAVANAFIQELFALAAAFVVAQLIKQEGTLNMASNFIGLSLAFLGGIFVPLEFFSEEVLRIAKVMPTYWYVTSLEASQKISTMPGAYSDVAKGFVIQGLYCVVILLIGLIVSRAKAREEA